MLSLSKMKCSPDKSTSNEGIGRRRLVAFPVGRVGGESCSLRRSCFRLKMTGYMLETMSERKTKRLEEVTYLPIIDMSDQNVVEAK